MKDDLPSPFGEYEILELLGKGGMGKVYRARHLPTDSPVAVKVLTGAEDSGEQAVRRFQREADIHRSLLHPNLVRVYDAGVIENRNYISMELVDGCTLADYLKGSGTLPADMALHILHGVASGLSHLHQMDVIHRDLKPGNVLIGDNGLIKLTDFGLARRLDHSEITQANAIIGTLHYLAPEIARGAPANKASDVFSLGLLTYRLLADELPFDADTVSTWFAQLLNSPARPLREHRPDLPHAIQELTMQMLEKDPELRPHMPQVTQELIASLPEQDRSVGILPMRFGVKLAEFRGKARISRKTEASGRILEPTHATPLEQESSRRVGVSGTIPIPVHGDSLPAEDTVAVNREPSGSRSLQIGGALGVAILIIAGSLFVTRPGVAPSDTLTGGTPSIGLAPGSPETAIDPGTPELIRKVQDKGQSLADRKSALESLARTDRGRRIAAQLFLELIETEDQEVEEWEEQFASDLGPAMDPHLEHLVKRTDPGRNREERIQALDLLKAVGKRARAHLTTLIPLTFDEDPEIREDAVEVVVEIAPEASETHEVVLRCIKDHASEVRRHAAKGLEYLPAEVAVPQLIELVDDKDRGIKKYACRALKKHLASGNPQVMSALIRCDEN